MLLRKRSAVKPWYDYRFGSMWPNPPNWPLVCRPATACATKSPNPQTDTDHNTLALQLATSPKTTPVCRRPTRPNPTSWQKAYGPVNTGPALVNSLMAGMRGPSASRQTARNRPRWAVGKRAPGRLAPGRRFRPQTCTRQKCVELFFCGSAPQTGKPSMASTGPMLVCLFLLLGKKVVGDWFRRVFVGPVRRSASLGRPQKWFDWFWEAPETRRLVQKWFQLVWGNSAD